jgi:hypothetical protein
MNPNTGDNMLIFRTTVSPKRKICKVKEIGWSSMENLKISRPTGDRLYIKAELFDGSEIELSLNNHDIDKLKSFI